MSTPTQINGIEAAPVPRIGGASLTQQVLAAIIRAIRQGSFAGGRLPAEDQFGDMMGVSRTTVRTALQSLEQIGLIERRPGRGTRLRKHASPDLLALHGLVPMPTLLRELGYEVATKVAWRRLDEAPPELEERLERAVDGGVYDVDVVLFADGEPAVAMTERFPEDVLRFTPSDPDLQAGSILFVSERFFQQRIDHALATLEPRATAGKGEEDPAKALALPPHTPYLALKETFYSADEVPLATSEVLLNPKYVSFSVFRRFL